MMQIRRRDAYFRFSTGRIRISAGTLKPLVKAAYHSQRQSTISAHHLVHPGSGADHSNQRPLVEFHLIEAKSDCFDWPRKIHRMLGMLIGFRECNENLQAVTFRSAHQ